MKLRTLALTALLAAAALPAFAGETPATLTGATLVSAEKARDLMASGAKMVDTRVAGEYAESHIKGAVLATYKEKSAKEVNYDPAQDDVPGFLTKLEGVAKKSDKLIFQCNGPECWKSYKGAKAAQGAGYSSVFWFRDGLPGWKAKGFPVE